MLGFGKKPPPPPPPAPQGPAAWYGKLPSLGDFASRRMAPALIDAWDDWLSRGLAAWRTQHEGWLQDYLAGPCWQLLLAPGALAPAAPALAGALLPSVDQVGRYYPLVLASPLQAWPPTEAALGGVLAWTAPLARLATDAMLDDWPPDRLEQALADLGRPQPSLGDDPLPAWAAALATGAGRGSAWWWLDGGPGVAAPSLPQGEAFRLLLGGDVESLARMPQFARL